MHVVDIDPAVHTEKMSEMDHADFIFKPDDMIRGCFVLHIVEVGLRNDDDNFALTGYAGVGTKTAIAGQKNISAGLVKMMTSKPCRLINIRALWILSR